MIVVASRSSFSGAMDLTDLLFGVLVFIYMFCIELLNEFDYKHCDVDGFSLSCMVVREEMIVMLNKYFVFLARYVKKKSNNSL